MATNAAPELSISDLADILTTLTEVTKPYRLGIQLKINSSKLDEIEKNHPRDIDRQKTEVINYWLRNSPDASWTTLAKAVEGVGGHAKLAQILKQANEEGLYDPLHMKKRSFYVPVQIPKPQPSTLIALRTCDERNILLLGKMGHGKSTIGNRMLNSDGCFDVNGQKCPQTSKGSAVLRSVSHFKDYMINIYDHDGLLESASSIEGLSFDISGYLNTVILVLKHGHKIDVEEKEIITAALSKMQINEISALVLTHCERLSEEERERMIEQFRKDHPSVAELMGKGILAVGFPDSSHIQSGSELSQRVEDDKKKLRQLIYSCDAKVKIVKHQQPLASFPYSESFNKDLTSTKFTSEKVVASNHSSDNGCKVLQHPVISQPENRDQNLQDIQRESKCEAPQHQRTTWKSRFCLIM